MMAFARRRRTDWPSRWQELGKVAVDAAPALQRYYDTPLPDPTTELAQASLVALDLETTGLDARHDAIVSVGLLPFDLQRVRTSQARYWVVKPDTELAAESVTFHHLTHSDLAEAPPLSTSWRNCSMRWPARWRWCTTGPLNVNSSTGRHVAFSVRPCASRCSTPCRSKPVRSALPPTGF